MTTTIQAHNLYTLADAMLRPFDKFQEIYKAELKADLFAAIKKTTTPEQRTNKTEFREFYSATRKQHRLSFVNSQDSFGFTLLHYAVARSRMDIVDFLLEEGANPHLKNDQGRSAYNLATPDERARIAANLSDGSNIQELPESVASLPLQAQPQIYGRTA